MLGFWSGPAKPFSAQPPIVTVATPEDRPVPVPAPTQITNGTCSPNLDTSCSPLLHCSSSLSRLPFPGHLTPESDAPAAPCTSSEISATCPPSLPVSLPLPDHALIEQQARLLHGRTLSRPLSSPSSPLPLRKFGSSPTSALALPANLNIANIIPAPHPKRQNRCRPAPPTPQVQFLSPIVVPVAGSSNPIDDSNPVDHQGFLEISLHAGPANRCRNPPIELPQQQQQQHAFHRLSPSPPSPCYPLLRRSLPHLLCEVQRLLPTALLLPQCQVNRTAKTTANTTNTLFSAAVLPAAASSTPSKRIPTPPQTLNHQTRPP